MQPSQVSSYMRGNLLPNGRQENAKNNIKKIVYKEPFSFNYK